MNKRNWRFRNAFKCRKCPESNGDDGCPSWWEFPNASGQIVKGCGFSQEVMLGILASILREAEGAAASADKATNHAVDAVIASRSAMNAASTGAALVLGAMTGEIEPVTRIEDRRNGDAQILPPSRPLD